MLQVTFSKTKKDPKGYNCNQKHIYGNPLDPTTDWNLSMGCFLATQRERTPGDDHWFGGNTAHKTYSKQVKKLVDDNKETVIQFGGGNISTTHSLRQGAATKASCGTTAAPPVASIMRHGDWSMGVLDRWVRWVLTNHNILIVHRILLLAHLFYYYFSLAC